MSYTPPRVVKHSISENLLNLCIRAFSCQANENGNKIPNFELLGMAVQIPSSRHRRAIGFKKLFGMLCFVLLLPVPFYLVSRHTMDTESPRDSLASSKRHSVRAVPAIKHAPVGRLRGGESDAPSELRGGEDQTLLASQIPYTILLNMGGSLNKEPKSVVGNVRILRLCLVH